MNFEIEVGTIDYKIFEFTYIFGGTKYGSSIEKRGYCDLQAMATLPGGSNPNK